MPGTFTCHHCGKTLPRNPRIKKQKFCSSRGCQNARKRLHDKKVISTAKGKLNQQGRNKRWRGKAPAHAYQAAYRGKNPEYEQRNREQQRLRNKGRRKEEKDASSMIVKTDALLLQPRHDGAYMVYKVKKQKIVKTDTLMLQMHSQQGIEVRFT
jgi:endogenous inhibitor of DNA gyrase (YacG/DUF329 family)